MQDKSEKIAFWRWSLNEEAKLYTCAELTVGSLPSLDSTTGEKKSVSGFLWVRGNEQHKLTQHD